MNFSLNIFKNKDILNFTKLIVIFYLKIIIILATINIYIKNLKYRNNLVINQTTNSKIRYNLFELYNFDKLYFEISQINYSFSLKFNITKVQYNIRFYDYHHNLLFPSYLTLYYNLHIFCHSKEFNNNISIIYIANIYENKYFSCIDNINKNEIIKFGISIYKTYNYIEFYKINLFDSNIINYNNYILKKNDEFDPLLQINNFKQSIQHLNSFNKLNIKDSFLLKKSYYLMPNYNIKSNLAYIEEKWFLKNIYNNYFCFCKYSVNSKCLYKNINQRIKYNLYLYFIDNNRNLYNKTNYLIKNILIKEWIYSFFLLLLKMNVAKERLISNIRYLQIFPLKILHLEKLI